MSGELREGAGGRGVAGELRERGGGSGRRGGEKEEKKAKEGWGEEGREGKKVRERERERERGGERGGGLNITCSWLTYSKPSHVYSHILLLSAFNNKHLLLQSPTCVQTPLALS